MHVYLTDYYEILIP